MKTIARVVFIGLGVLAMFVGTAVAETPYEVWGIDQSNSPGKTFGGFEGLAPVTNIDQGGVERADVHALTIRVK